MSVRQYIGARYVTKVYENSLDPSSAEWEGGRAYEPLTLVTYLNSSYLSKKEVPASVGDPASNPTYWVITGAYNGQIAYLQTQINELRSKGYIFLSDSYGQYTDTDGKTYIDLLTEKLNPAYSYDFHMSGRGFVNTGNGTFLELLQDNESSIADRSAITDVVVLGGANDHDQAVNTILSAIKTFVNYVKANYPNAKISIGQVGTHRSSGAEIQYFEKRSIPAYKRCSEYGATYLTGSEIILHSNTLLRSDLVHPNDNGIKALASGVYNALTGGRGHIKASSTAVLAAQNVLFSAISYTSSSVVEETDDDFTSLHFNGDRRNIELTCVSGLTGSRWMEQIGSFADPLIFDGERKLTIPCTAEAVDASNNILGIMAGSFYIGSDGNLYIQLASIGPVDYSTASILRVSGTGSASIYTAKV